VFAWPSPVAAQSAPPRDLQDIVAAKVLRVALTHFDLPAFHWSAKGTFEGPEMELARQIAKALGIGIDFIDTPASFDDVVGAVADGRADIGISKLSQTYYRLMRVRFSDPYITLRHGLRYDRTTLAAHSDGRPPEEMFRHFEARIGVIANSAYVDFGHRNFPAAEIVALAGWDAVVEGLQKHRVDAIYRDEFEILRLLKVHPGLNVQFGAAIVTDQKAYLSIAICNTCSKMTEFINYHITQTQGMFKLPNLLASDLGK
jgi:polar amino acid transport system substrate-binding protein